MSPRGNQQLRLMSPQPARSSFRFLVVDIVCLTESPDDRHSGSRAGVQWQHKEAKAVYEKLRYPALSVVKKTVLPSGCTALLAASRLQRSDDFAIFPFAKGFHGLSGHVAQRPRGQHEFRARLIIGKFRDDDGVVLSHRQVPGVNLSSRFLCSLLGSIEPRRAFLDFCGSLLGVADQRNEVRHTAFLLIRD
jgi:hypothetical protein